MFRSPVAIAASRKLSCYKSSSAVATDIATELVHNLVNLSSSKITDTNLIFQIQITETGWIEYHLQDTSLSDWLDWHLSAYNPRNDCHIKYQIPENILPLQYIHARCCAILRLAQQTKLISRSPNWLEEGIIQSWPWLEPNGQWSLTTERELNLVHQILRIAHAWDSPSASNWYQLAVNLALCWLDFERYSTIIGRDNRNLARLGLTAIAQFWLSKLMQQLGIEASAIL